VEVCHQLPVARRLRLAAPSSRHPGCVMRTPVMDLTQETTLHTLIRDEERFRTILSQMPDAIFILDPERDRVLYANPQACRLLGYSLEELLATPSSRLNPNQMPKLMTLCQAPPGGPPLITEITSITKGGVPVLGEVAASVARVGGHVCLIASIRDISARIQESNQRVEDAMHDPLTCLPNRALFEDRFEVALKRQERNGTALALLLFDIDGFKLVNDTSGHEAGDDVLRTTATTLKSVLRPSDAAARFGGDEFVVLCEDIKDERAAIHVARRITNAMAEARLPADGQTLPSISMGIAVTMDHSTDAGAIIGHADAALYRAKRNGRGRYELFDERMRMRAQERLKDEVALQQAIACEELRLVYQPQINLKTGEVAGGEALIRWEHPERGWVLPGEFIPLAEETNLIVPIGSWVLKQACLTAQLWRAARPIKNPVTMSVNVSAKQLSQSELVDDVAQILEETATDPSSLCLEITESVIGADSPTSVRQLHGLKDLGICLVMDDFGKGFSSLSYLRSLPVDVLKIDQSFVLGACQPQDRALLQAAVDMAHALDLKVVAEGVENGEQLEKVQDSGSDLAQGFYLGRPQESLASL
jgi:diguanylate cyclase (GGDEF)-like protein/PAS domain S-box-containing protein